VAIDAKTHVVFDDAFGHSHGSDIAMARRTVHPLPHVGGMIESDVSFLNPSIHALPGDIFAAVVKRSDLLDFRILDERVDVAVPACADIGNSRSCASINCDMTIPTFEFDVFHMRPMNECNRLSRFAAYAEEMTHGLSH
jgi:hypothetical protein